MRNVPEASRWRSCAVNRLRGEWFALPQWAHHPHNSQKWAVHFTRLVLELSNLKFSWCCMRVFGNVLLSGVYLLACFPLFWCFFHYYSVHRADGTFKLFVLQLWTWFLVLIPLCDRGICHSLQIFVFRKRLWAGKPCKVCVVKGRYVVVDYFTLAGWLAQHKDCSSPDTWCRCCQMKAGKGGPEAVLRVYGITQR
jgi:hypothetical protein